MKSMKLVLGALIIVGAIFATWKIVPPYFYHYQFSDALETLTMNQTYRDTTEEQVRDLVIRTAHENDVDLAPENVTVRRDAGGLSISVAYSVPVDLAVTQVNLSFNSASAGKRY